MTLGARKNLAALLVLGALFGAVSGCGGKSGTTVTTSASSPGDTAQARPPSTPSSSSATPGRPPTKAQLIAQADAICKRLNGELAAATAKNGSAKEVERVVPRHASLERHAVGELEALAAPSSLERSWKAILADRRTLASELDELVQAAKHNDGAAAKALAESKKRVHDRLLKAASAVGFSYCTRVG